MSSSNTLRSTVLNIILCAALAVTNFLWFTQSAALSKDNNTLVNEKATLQQSILGLEQVILDKERDANDAVTQQNLRDQNALKNSFRRAEELRNHAVELDAAIRLRDATIESLQSNRSPTDTEVALTAIYRECSSELGQMGQNAQGHVNDITTLTERLKK